MIKKAYNITGFDCANCARKTEEHLNNHKLIQSARIDFAGNRLYLSFKENELTIDEILNIIKEVETDDISLTSIDVKVGKRKIFTKDLWILLGRVLFGVLAIIVCYAFFNTEDYYWVRFGVYLFSLLVMTYDIIYKVFNKIIHFKNPIDEYLLITISAYGAFAVSCIDTHDFLDCLMVVMLFQVGRVIEGIATNKSKEAIMAAVDLRVEQANVLRNGELVKVSPEDIKIDDIVVVVAGERVSVDGVIEEGDANIDVSSLTGEFVPVKGNVGDKILSGSVIKTGSLKIRALKEYKDSTVKKIIDLIALSGEKKSKADKFITRFARIYTPCVLLVAGLFAIIGGAITKDWNYYALSGLKMLVVACPCAVVISVPMAYFSGLGLASKKGIVIKGASYLEELIQMKKLICDKTGTLTHGSFSVQKIVSNIKEKEFLEYLYASECLSTHPIAKAICHGQNLKKIAANVSNFEEISGKGTSIIYQGESIISGNLKYMKDNRINVPETNETGTIVYTAYDHKYIGYVVISDELKKDAQPMVNLLHSDGVEIILLTGDKEENAKAICNELGIDRYKAELMPEEKTESLVQEMSPNGKYAVGFIGDGINDAASIRRSDIGIAMGGIGSDVAVENADIVIMNDDPAKVWDAIKIGRMARNTALFNIITALSIKIALEIVIACIGDKVPMFVAVLADTGLTVLLVLNSLFLLYRQVKRKRV